MALTGPTRHFACTACGACCNRAPEVELGETLALADVFAWQLLLRLYSLPRYIGDYLSGRTDRDQASEEFRQSKALLSQFAAHSYNAKTRVGGKVQERVFYLTVSALALGDGTSACPARDGSLCAIYDRRPLSCRSVPLHYSRAPAFAAADLDQFVSTPGFACATDTNAPVVIESGDIIDPAIRSARAAALAQSDQDRAWKSAIVKAIRTGQARWPGLREIEQHAAHAAVLLPIAMAWQLAGRTGLAKPDALSAAQDAQLARLDQLIGKGGSTAADALALRRSFVSG